MTVTDGAGTIDVNIAFNASLNVRFIAKTQPGTPYVVTYAYVAGFRTDPGVEQAIYFYDGTKLLGFGATAVTLGQVPRLRVLRWNSVTSSGATSIVADQSVEGPGFGLFYMRQANDGTNLTFSFSLDGITYHTFWTETLVTWLTPTHYGIGGVQNASGSAFNNPVTISLQSVVVT
jgi:hypothetical protein